MTPRLLHVVTVPATLSLMRGQLGHLVAAGFDVHFVCSPDESGTPVRADHGVTRHEVLLRRTLSPAADLASVVRLSALFRKLRPDIVQAGTPKAGLLGMIAAKLCGIPVRIYHMRGLDGRAGTRGRAMAAEAAARTACTLATQVLCVSESMRKTVIDAGFCEPGKVHVHLRGSSNGVDAADRFNPAQYSARRSDVRRSLGIPEDSPVIGFVGRLVRDKGIETLARSWTSLRAEFPNARLLLVGPFEDADALPRLVREQLENDPRVRITQTAWGEACPIYSAMDVVGFPSQREGFPNVPLEAAAMGLPVVAARIPGSVDAVVHGVTGILVEPRDSEALAQSLARLLRDPELARSFGAAARQRVLRDFRPQDLWDAQVSWYRGLLAQHSEEHTNALRTYDA